MVSPHSKSDVGSNLNGVTLSSFLPGTTPSAMRWPVSVQLASLNANMVQTYAVGRILLPLQLSMLLSADSADFLTA
jgi:hypothetical protein